MSETRTCHRCQVHLVPNRIHTSPCSWLALVGRPLSSVFASAVERMLLFSPQDGVSTVKVNVAWDENDYQIDIASPAGRAEYKRIIDRNAQFGITHIVYEPRNTNYGTELGIRLEPRAVLFFLERREE